MISASKSSSAADERRRVARRGQNVSRNERIGAAEAAVEMHRLDPHAIDREIGERRVELGLGIALQVALARVRVGMGQDRPADRQTRVVERIAAVGRAGQQQRAARVAGEILGVLGERGEQEQRRAVEIAGAADPGRQRRTFGAERRQSGGARQAQQPLGVGDRGRPRLFRVAPAAMSSSLSTFAGVDPPPAGRDKARRAGVVKRRSGAGRAGANRDAVEHSAKRAILGRRSGARRAADASSSAEWPRGPHFGRERPYCAAPRCGSDGRQPTRRRSERKTGASCRRSPWSTTTATS